LKGLRLLKLTKNGGLLNAAAVLFAKDTELNYPQCLLRLVRFKGNSKSNIIDSKHIHGNAFSLLEYAEDFCLRHTSIKSKFTSGKMAREDIPDYPPRAIREAIINALCHRNYSIKSGSISLMIFDDRLEITNYGTLPLGITIDDLKHEHDSQPRNQRITQVLYRCGIIESVGTGTQEMIELCKNLGKPEPEYIERGNTFVVCFLQTHPLPHTTTELTSRQTEIIKILSEKENISASLILASLSDTLAERTLRDDLTKLKKLGLIKSSGKGRGTVWSLMGNKAVNKAE